MFPAEQQRVVKLLIEKVVVAPDSIEVRLSANGLERISARREQKTPQTRCCGEVWKFAGIRRNSYGCEVVGLSRVKGCPFSPLTPPYMRFRIRRFK